MRVWVDTFDKLLAETRSDRSGRFQLGPLSPIYRHRFPILIDADGFARQYVRPGSYSIFPALIWIWVEFGSMSGKRSKDKFSISTERHAPVRTWSAFRRETT